MAKSGKISGVSFKITGKARKRLAEVEKLTADLKPLFRAVSINQAEEVVDLIKQGFREASDPYGKKWKKRKRETRRTRGRMVLSGETSRLKGGWKHTQVRVDGFIVTASVTYATPHQKPKRGGAKGGGRLKRPRRRMIPSEKDGLPRKWSKALNAAANDAINDYFRVSK